MVSRSAAMSPRFGRAIQLRYRAMKKSAIVAIVLIAPSAFARRTQKPPLHGRHWMAVTGKPLAATAGAMIFQKGGNAVDAAAAMIAAACTMWDTLSWGGERLGLIYNPARKSTRLNSSH